MIYSVVDIGSNTIRLQLYQYKKGKLKTIISKKKTAGLISYKENNKLNDEGIQTLLSILKSFKNLKFTLTAVIRNLKNSDDILQLIKEELNIDIYLLESKTEAMMSFNAVKNSGKMTCDEGILCDVGGGSSEIVYFNNRTPQELTSIDIGSLNSYYKYVSVMLPSTSECEAIRNDVLEKIKKSEVNKHTVTHLYAVGGTIRAIKKVLEHICIKEDKTSIITPAMLKKLQSELNKNNKEYFTKILQVKAERIHTLVPGLVIIATIAEYFNIKQIHVSHKTVREGVVYSIIENDKNDNE